MTAAAEHRSDPVGAAQPLRRLRILLVDVSDRGGIERYTGCLARALSDAGLQVARAGPPGVGDPGLQLHPLRWGPDVERLHRARRALLRSGEAVMAFDQLWRSVRRADPDIVHVQSEVVPGVDHLALRAIGRRQPVVATVHDPLPLLGGARAAADQARRWRAVQALVVHGEEPRPFVEASAPGVPVHVVPVDLPLGGNPPSRSEARRRLGVGAGPLAVLLGQLREYKGLAVLADAWPTVAGTVPDARLVLAGQRYPSAALDRLLTEPQVALHEGFLADHELDLWAAAADVVLLPYHAGSHSGVLHRALAAGTPVLASPPLAAEVHRTAAGAVVPLDAGAWAEAVEGALGRCPMPVRPPRSGTGTGTVAAHVALYRTLVAGAPDAVSHPEGRRSGRGLPPTARRRT